MDTSVPVFEKPHPRQTVLDWTRNIQRLQNEARTRRFDSYQLRQQSNQLRNESNVTTIWDNYVNNELLRDRVFEVESWRENQRFTRELVRDEMRALKEEKNATELHLESLQVPLSVLMQCLSNRDQRVPPELTRDQLGDELTKELHIIENSKRVLTDVCHMGWEKIKELNNVFCRLEREIQNKDDALMLEYHVKDLNRESSDISYKLDPTRVPPETMSEKSYVDCIQNTIKIAEQLMSESKALRETMFKSCEQARNQMYAQCQNVEMVMRRRLFDTQRARNEMEWQKHKLENNLQKTNREIESLRAAIADKINPTKLVETRLEIRTRRPVLERVQVSVSGAGKALEPVDANHPPLAVRCRLGGRAPPPTLPPRRRRCSPRLLLRLCLSVLSVLRLRCLDTVMNGLIEEFERLHLSTSMLKKKLEEALKMNAPSKFYKNITRCLRILEGDTPKSLSRRFCVCSKGILHIDKLSALNNGNSNARQLPASVTAKRQTVKERINVSFHTSNYHGLHSHYERIKKDLQYKNQSLETDRRLIEIRKPLHGPDETEFQRNVGYCHMSNELVPD